MAGQQPILEMRGITKEFPGVKALDNVTMTVQPGEIHAICGENGAGKSTLMKVLSGVYPHGSYKGKIFYKGKEVEFKNIRESEDAGIVIIHQELALIPELSVTENIFLGNEMKTGQAIDWRAARKKAQELLNMVDLKVSPDEPVKNLGVGQQQLVEIAKALSKNVELLILDEPTAALNEHDSMLLLKLMKQLRDRGMTMIIISHKLNEITDVANSITIIRDGQTVETLDVDSGQVDEDRIIRGMVGRALDSRFPEHTPKIGPVLLEVDNWLVEDANRPGRYLCKDSSFFVRRGEIIGFAGIMGAGRTELVRSIFGDNASAGTDYNGRFIHGTIKMDGKEIKVPNVRAAIANKIAYVSEDRKKLGFNPHDSIEDTVVSANWGHTKVAGALNDSKKYKRAEHFRKAMRIKTPSVREGIAKLSGGNQQKVLLGKWLHTEPDILILDEPTRGIDVGAKYEIYELIDQFADDGKGVIVVSSELPELLGLCDRIYTIFEGKITGVIDREHATQENLMRLMTGASVDQVIGA